MRVTLASRIDCQSSSLNCCCKRRLRCEKLQLLTRTISVVERILTHQMTEACSIASSWSEAGVHSASVSTSVNMFVDVSRIENGAIKPGGRRILRVAPSGTLAERNESSYVGASLRGCPIPGGHIGPPLRRQDPLRDCFASLAMTGEPPHPALSHQGRGEDGRPRRAAPTGIMPVTIRGGLRCSRS